jgi:hypothetical protein
MSANKPYPLGGIQQDRDPQWSRIRSALLRANREFREATPKTDGTWGKKPAIKDPPLVGPAYGRLWEIIYYRPTYFSPDMLVNIVTAIRWDDPERMAQYETPWLYIGGRPRILSRLSPDLERIIEKQRRAERNLRGYQTGDPEFDRRWACYAYRARPSEVLREPARRRWLQALADLRPRRGDDMPTIASLGTTVSLAAVVSDSDETVRQASTLVQSFSQLLDAVELSTGNQPASQVPLTMDLLPDGTGYPSPTLRFRCAHCGQEAHPRFVPDFHTEICDQCRRGLYSSW